MSKEIVTLELFGGMGTGIQALKNLGWKGKHFYSDIKPAGIKVTKANHPETVFLGDITKINYINGFLFNDKKCYDVGKIDLISSGSPCTDLSIAGKRKGINGEKSKLFFEFIRLLNQVRTINPDVLFFQENVGSADKKDVQIISQALNIEPVRFNSSLVVAQLRDRYYWTNIKVKVVKNLFGSKNYSDFKPPKDRGISFQSILEGGYTDREKSHCILEGYYSKSYNPEINQKGLIQRYKMGMQSVKFTDRSKNKAVLLTSIELLRLQGFPDNYADCLTQNQTASVCGDGWTLPMIEHFYKEIKLP